MATIEAALSPDYAVGAPHVLTVPMGSDWPEANQAIATTARVLLAGDDTFDKRIAVFPIAPVSACLALGYHLTSRPHVRLFQHHRDEQTWAWPRRALPSDDIRITGVDGEVRDADAVTFAFYFSAAVTDEALVEAGAPLDCRIKIGVEAPSTTWLQHPEQLTCAVAATRRAFEAAMRLYPRALRWHLFYAGPAPLAIAIGQQINPTMYPAVQLYEYRHKEVPRYRPSIVLSSPDGGEDDSSDIPPIRSQPPHENQYDEDDQDYADDSDSAVTESVAVAAEAATEAAEEENDEDDDKNESHRHGVISIDWT